MRRLSTSTLVSLGVITVVALGTFLTPLIQEGRQANAYDYVLPVIAFVMVLLRERYPVAALIIVIASTTIYYPLASYDGPLIVLPFLVLYTAADRGYLIPAIVTAAVALLAMGMGEIGPVRHVDNASFIMITGWMVAAIAAGGVTRNRRAYLHEVEQRALAAEHGREEEARRRESEERLRIARELHDVLGHNVSMINVQASAALHGLKKRPEDAESALKTIKDTSRETLRELRTTLGMLRQVDEDAPTAPADSLARVSELVAASGLRVDVEVSGSLEGIPTEVDLAAARIIRESLTNVSRHSGVHAASLAIARGDGNIVIRVEDGGPGVVYTEGSGFGLLGMRERVTALGGSLEAGPRPEGGFLVVATLREQA